MHQKGGGGRSPEEKKKITPARIFALTRQISLSEVSVGFSDIMLDYRRALPSTFLPPGFLALLLRRAVYYVLRVHFLTPRRFRIYSVRIRVRSLSR